ncbi:Zinc metalloproteinase nas-7 like protein [Argiope bruennichi]|uniref:Metalloendopeptidase n=1 Tax=Argiope bruennichi TaxID=94029 RepID=A0A8T0ECR4_ARGBR|nr:Zinc metalloproteinase nas-7 like protein [Argiope bruennichi]
MIKLSVFILTITFIFYGLCAKPLRKQRIRRNAYRNESRLWPKAVVPYTIDDEYSKQERSVIEKAMKDIQSISFLHSRTPTPKKASLKSFGAIFWEVSLAMMSHFYLDFVYKRISDRFRCRAVVGYIGRRSKLTLGHGCIWVARVLHELLHVLGFFHEHTRPDRDDFVTIFDDNIKTASINNFRKMSESKVTTFGLPYDFKSVLHYHDTGLFAIGPGTNQPTSNRKCQ